MLEDLGVQGWLRTGREWKAQAVVWCYKVEPQV